MWLREANIIKLAQALLIGTVVVTLLACSELPLQAPEPGNETAWQARQQALSAISNWRLTGRIAIQTEKEGWNAALRWSQEGGNYDISLGSPLGQDVLQLQGGVQGVSLRTSEGMDFAADGETLLYRHLGWRLPVSGLRYWVLGLPDPAVPAAQDRELDGLGRLTRLRQSGWDIEFRRYSPVNTVELPDKIFLTNQTVGVRLEVRLAVEQWDIVVINGK